MLCSFIPPRSILSLFCSEVQHCIAVITSDDDVVTAKYCNLNDFWSVTQLEDSLILQARLPASRRMRLEDDMCFCLCAASGRGDEDGDGESSVCRQFQSSLLIELKECANFNKTTLSVAAK